MRPYYFPTIIEKLLLEYALSKGYIRSLQEIPSLAATVQKISRSFTKGREEPWRKYLKDPQVRAAYLLYFLPANFPKIQVVLEELLLHPAFSFKNQMLRVLDIGSGPGTALLGLIHFFAQQNPSISLSLTALDHTQENLKDCQELLKKFGEQVKIPLRLNLIQQDIEKDPQVTGIYDFIMFSNSLNELFKNDSHRIEKRAQFLTRLYKNHLSAKGAMIFIEPALKQSSRELLQVRDLLLLNGLHLYAPCLDQAPCPALKTGKEDWCHEELPWEPPSIIRDLDQETGFIKDAVKYSYSVFTPLTINLACHVREKNLWRVVSDRIILKGDQRVFLCNGSQRILARRQDKHCSKENIELDSIKRGDIIFVSSLEKKNHLHLVTKSTHVRIIR